MRIKTYKLIILALALFVTLVVPKARANSTTSREYEIKAAFLYNFIKFTDWPKEKMGDVNEPIVIGIIGKDPFGDAIDVIRDEQVKGRKLVIRWFKSFEESKESNGKDKPSVHKEIEAIRKCHLLFFSSSEKKKTIGEIMKALESSHVLTVGDMNGFLETGGVINLITEDKKVRFEINISAAERAGLKFRSQLLRLAKRVIREDTPKDDKRHSSARQITGKPIMSFL